MSASFERRYVPQARPQDHNEGCATFNKGYSCKCQSPSNLALQRCLKIEGYSTHLPGPQPTVDESVSVVSLPYVDGVGRHE